MVNRRIWSILNVSLSLVSVILVLTLFGVELPTVGQAQYLLDTEDELCVLEWNNELSIFGDIDRCCLEAKKQLSCEGEVLDTEFGKTTKHCSTGASTVSFHLNQKAHNYCKGLGFW